MRSSVLAILPPALLVAFPAAAVNLAGSPCAFTFNGVAWQLAKTDAGNLVQSGDLIPADLLRSLPAAATTPLAAVGVVPAADKPAAQELHLTYRGKDGMLYDLGLYGRRPDSGEAGEWRLHRITPANKPFLGRPSTLMVDNAMCVVYREADGLLVTKPAGNEPVGLVLNSWGLTPSPLAAHDPAQVEVNGRREVFFADQHGVIYRLFQCPASEKPGAWDFAKLTNGGKTNAPAAAGPLSVLRTGTGVQVVYPDKDGLIFSIGFDEKASDWSVSELTRGREGTTPAPPAGAAL